MRFLCLIHCISSFFADRSVKRKQPSWKDVSTSFSYFPIPLSTLHTNEDCLTIGHLFLTPLLLHNSFRQIYREERRSLSLKNEGNTEPSPLSMNDPCSSEMSCRRHTISRVVVEHKDYFETFYELDDLASLTHQTGNTVFFDNDGFWSGSITWYWLGPGAFFCTWSLSTESQVLIDPRDARLTDMLLVSPLSLPSLLQEIQPDAWSINRRDLSVNSEANLIVREQLVTLSSMLRNSFCPSVSRLFSILINISMSRRQYIPTIRFKTRPTHVVKGL